MKVHIYPQAAWKWSQMLMGWWRTSLALILGREIKGNLVLPFPVGHHGGKEQKVREVLPGPFPTPEA